MDGNKTDGIKLDYFRNSNESGEYLLVNVVEEG